MKTRYFFRRPTTGYVSVKARDVPPGTIVLDRYGFWGVVEKTRFEPWEAPARFLLRDEYVLKPLHKAKIGRDRRRPKRVSTFKS